MLPLRRATALFVGAALLLAGCGMPPSPADSSTPSDLSTAPSPSPSGPVDSSPEAPGADGLDNVVAQTTIDLSSDTPVLVSPDPESTTPVNFSGDLQTGGQFTVSLQPGQTFALSLRAAEPIAAEPQIDSSVAILISDSFAFGVGAPNLVESEGLERPGSATSDLAWSVSPTKTEGVDSESANSGLTYAVSLTPDAEPATVALDVGFATAISTRWITREGEESLQIVPSNWGRTGGLTVQKYGWPSVLAMVGDSAAKATSDSMEHQFQCHVIGASNKETWNLEPWRPDVGLLKFMAARCNP